MKTAHSERSKPALKPRLPRLILQLLKRKQQERQAQQLRRSHA